MKREAASTSPPSLQLDLGQLDGAVKEILAYEGAMGEQRQFETTLIHEAHGEKGKAGTGQKMQIFKM